MVVEADLPRRGPRASVWDEIETVDDFKQPLFVELLAFETQRTLKSGRGQAARPQRVECPGVLRLLGRAGLEMGPRRTVESQDDSVRCRSRIGLVPRAGDRKGFME